MSSSQPLCPGLNMSEIRNGLNHELPNSEAEWHGGNKIHVTATALHDYLITFTLNENDFFFHIKSKAGDWSFVWFLSLLFPLAWPFSLTFAFFDIWFAHRVKKKINRHILSRGYLKR